MLMLKNNILIQCDNCGESITVNKEDLDFDDESYDRGENSMGVEIDYSLERQIECPHCNNQILLSISASEYPQGALNIDDDAFKIEGGSFIEIPEIELPDDYQ